MTPFPLPPTPAEIRAAAGKTVPDLLALDLCVLFCGINPGLYSGAAGFHFARPGNRIWAALHRSGFTDRQLAPHETGALLAAGLGLTNLVARATASASELSVAELVSGSQLLTENVRRYRPRCLAMLGIGAYRTAFARPATALGRQPETIEATFIWVLPNPSGLNAHYQLEHLAQLFSSLRQALADGSI